MLVVFTLTVVVPCHCFWTCSELLAPSLPPCSALNCIVSSSHLFPSIAPADATKPVERGHGHHRRSAASAGPAGTHYKPSYQSSYIFFIYTLFVFLSFSHLNTHSDIAQCRDSFSVYNSSKHTCTTKTATPLSQKHFHERPHLHCFCTHFVNLAVLFFKWAVVFLNYLWRKLS